MNRIKILIILVSLVGPAFAAALPLQNKVPGGIALVPVTSASKPKLNYNGKQVLVLKKDTQWLAVVGLPLSAKPGRHQLIDIKTAEKTSFMVTDKTYKAQYITLKNKRMVSPQALDMKRIRKEKLVLNQALATHSQHIPSFGFRLPVVGRLSSPFGLKRFFNQQPRKPHSGLDIAAPRGSDIHAPADAVVLNTGKYYFNGNTVLLDHGSGLISGYFHLNKINVRPGDNIKQGQILGQVGDTGRATGPHLHWNIYLNGNKVDPELFIADDIQLLKNTKPIL